MAKSRAIRVAAGGLSLALLGLALAGCATGDKSPMARRLNQHEADKLVSTQGFRSQGKEQPVQMVSDPMVLESQGDQMALAGKFTGAALKYNRALMQAGKEQKIRLQSKLGELYLRLRHFAQAEAVFSMLSKQNSLDAHAWQGMGLARLGQGKSHKAMEALERAVELRPQSFKAHNGLGIIYNHHRQPGRAIEQFSLAIKYGPKLAELYNNRGLAFLLAGDLARAEADFRRALSIKPRFKLAHNNLALLLAKGGRYDQAYRSFAKGSGQAQAHNNLGVLMSWQGRNDLAARYFGKALDSSPRYYPKASGHLDQIKSASEGMPVMNSGTLPRPVAQPVMRPVAPRPRAKPEKHSLFRRGGRPFLSDRGVVSGGLPHLAGGAMVAGLKIEQKKPPVRLAGSIRPAIKPEGEPPLRQANPARPASFRLAKLNQGRSRVMWAKPQPESGLWRGAMPALPQ